MVVHVLAIKYQNYHYEWISNIVKCSQEMSSARSHLLGISNGCHLSTVVCSVISALGGSYLVHWPPSILVMLSYSAGRFFGKKLGYRKGGAVSNGKGAVKYMQ